MALRKLPTLLILGLIIREVFSFWTGHPSDFELWVRMGYAMMHGGNPYGILSPAPGLSFANVYSATNEPTIAYLPFWPLLTGLVYRIYSVVGMNNRFVYYFLLKQPIILGDVSLAYLLYSYVTSRKPESGFWVLSFWLFSPFTIIISGIWGMFDSIAICFIILSASSIGRVRRVLWASLAIFVKSIPIILAAPLTLKNGKSPKDVASFIATVGLPAVMSLLIFVVMGWRLSTVGTTLMSTAGKGGWSMSIWSVFPFLDNLEVLPPVLQSIYGILGLVWIPVMVLFSFIAIRRFRTETDAGLIQAMIVCVLVFLVFKAQVTEQYALYLFALGAVDVVLWNPQRKPILISTMIVALLYLVMNNYFLVRFLSPVYPNFVDFETMMYHLIGPIRYVLLFVTGTLFTLLNIKYLADILTS